MRCWLTKAGGVGTLERPTMIRKELQPQLEEAVEALGQSMGEEYSLKLEGPWPPFSFVERVELHLSHA